MGFLNQMLGLPPATGVAQLPLNVRLLPIVLPQTPAGLDQGGQRIPGVLSLQRVHLSQLGRT